MTPRRLTTARRTGDASCALGFVLLIALVPSLAFFRPAPASSVEREFRRPAAEPGPVRDVAGLRAWPAAFDAWYRDHFGLRASFIRLYNRALLELFEVSPSSEIVVGPEQWMFTTRDHAVDVFRGADPLRPRELELWARVLAERGEWCAQHGIAFVFALAPNKETIYPERFPARFDVLGPTRRGQLVELARERTDVPLLDLTDALLRAKGDFASDGESPGEVYFPYGTHWNDRGVVYAAEALLRRVADLDARVVPRPRAAFRFRPSAVQGDSWAGRLYVDDLLRQGNVELEFERRIPAEAWQRLLAFAQRRDRTREENARFEIAPLPDAREQGWHITVLEGRHVSVDQPGLDAPRAVVFHDSMGEKLRPLLAEAFAHVDFRWLPELDTDFVERAQPDVVIQLAVERQLAAVLPATSPLDTAERLAREFAAATHIVLASEDALRAGALAPQTDAPVQLVPEADGTWRVDYGGGGLYLPELAVPAGCWPVLRIEFDAPEASALLVEFLSARFPVYSRQARGVQRPVAAGSNVVYVKLRVPELCARLRLHLGLAEGSYRLRSLEVRAVPE